MLGPTLSFPRGFTVWICGKYNKRKLSASSRQAGCVHTSEVSDFGAQRPCHVHGGLGCLCPLPLSVSVSRCTPASIYTSMGLDPSEPELVM